MMKIKHKESFKKDPWKFLENEKLTKQNFIRIVNKILRKI